jgi:hypothetical protein
MKKQVKKLVLSKETLKDLDTAQVVGGTVGSGYQGCFTYVETRLHCAYQ